MHLIRGRFLEFKYSERILFIMNTYATEKQRAKGICILCIISIPETNSTSA